MSKQILHKGKWLSYGIMEATTPKGKTLTWEFVTRENTPGAVCIIAIKPEAEPKIILVKQFRPPLRSEILEMPAGLVEHGQSKEDAALRELKEETGYIGEIISQGPPIYNTPGMTDENVTCMTVKVTQQTEQETEPDEEIEVMELPLRNLKEELLKLHAEGLHIDAKLWSLSEGLAMSNQGFFI